MLQNTISLLYVISQYSNSLLTIIIASSMCMYIDHEQKPKSENVCNAYGFVFTEIKNTHRETSLGIQHGSYI